MPIFGKKDKQGNLACNFTHIDGIKNFPPNIAVVVAQEDRQNRLSIAMRISKKPPVYLNYEQITSVAVITEKEILEKDKSVIGRAVIGGVLLGSLGAIVGSISGVGTKKYTVRKFFFVVNYRPSNNPKEIKVLSFEIVGASLHWDSFVRELKKKIPSLPEQPPSPPSQYL